MKKLLVKLLTLLLLLSLAGCHKKADNSSITMSTGSDIEIVETDKDNFEQYLERNREWDAKYHITHDYRGRIRVGELIDLDFVQGETNSTYLRRDWESMNYDEEGSIFMDYRNTLDDENIIIYGHYVYSSYDPSGTHKFTPLKELLKEENYKKNRSVVLELSDQIRTYEIAHVYYCDTYTDEYGDRYPNDKLRYFETEFTNDYFTEYLQNVSAVEFYDTGIELIKGDNLLTLQTCVENRPDLREIVICKEVSRVYTR